MKKRSNRSWRQNRAGFQYFQYISERHAEKVRQKRAADQLMAAMASKSKDPEGTSAA